MEGAWPVLSKRYAAQMEWGTKGERQGNAEDVEIVGPYCCPDLDEDGNVKERLLRY